MALVISEETKAKIRASLSATKARRQTQVCRVFELKVSIRHNPKEVFQKLAKCFKEAKWVINDMLSLSKDNPDNSMFDYKYTEHKNVVHYDKDKNLVTSTITLPSVLHRATVAQNSIVFDCSIVVGGRAISPARPPFPFYSLCGIT